jgi:hypothetical protein
MRALSGKRTLSTAVLALTSILLVLNGAAPGYAAPTASSNSIAQPQILSASVIGGVTSLGRQIYTVSGGQVAFALIAGQTVEPQNATIFYSFKVVQTGLSSVGEAAVDFVGTSTTGEKVSVVGSFVIGGNVPAAELPVGCSSSCRSALPFVFIGASSAVQVTVENSSQTKSETLEFESPYFNPFGGPILLSSPDGSIVIAATYTQGTILWVGTQLGGQMIGTLGSTPVTGSFNMTSNENENLVLGDAIDAGVLQFSSMSPSSLNGGGVYIGLSTIPTAGTKDCSILTGVPGTCTETGFQSTGEFFIPRISGGYSSSWGVPALGFSSAIRASVT